MKVLMATGRRKTAVAQVRLLPGSGKFIVNKININEYFPVEVNRVEVMRPLEVTGMEGKLDIFASVNGGGKDGQTGAVQLAIARALVDLEESFRKQLRLAKLLTRDPRMVERKKYGQKKARKRFQFSKR